jgi:hypothetical protein
MRLIANLLACLPLVALRRSLAPPVSIVPISLSGLLFPLFHDHFHMDARHSCGERHTIYQTHNLDLVLLSFIRTFTNTLCVLLNFNLRRTFYARGSS